MKIADVIESTLTNPVIPLFSVPFHEPQDEITCLARLAWQAKLAQQHNLEEASGWFGKYVPQSLFDHHLGITVKLWQRRVPNSPGSKDAFPCYTPLGKVVPNNPP